MITNAVSGAIGVEEVPSPCTVTKNSVGDCDGIWRPCWKRWSGRDDELEEAY